MTIKTLEEAMAEIERLETENEQLRAENEELKNSESEHGDNEAERPQKQNSMSGVSGNEFSSYTNDLLEKV
ncbi:MAG: hypothetical protein ACNI3A_01505 [Desulfovibrio sp.]|uniref:hypothetical protein n=1 Tax=Desulfovibrio sp. 7SRBS1 TaxID=3378064 RepID=UPI003B3FF857